MSERGGAGPDWTSESATLRRRRLAVAVALAELSSAQGGVERVRAALGGLFQACLLECAGLDGSEGGRFEFSLVRPDDPTFDAPLGTWVARVPMAGLGSPRFDRRFEAVGSERQVVGAFRGMRLLGATSGLPDPDEAAVAELALLAAAAGAASTTYPKGGFDVRRVGDELHLFRRLKVVVLPIGSSRISVWQARKLQRGATVGSVLRVRKPREQDFDWVTPVLGWLADPAGAVSA